MTVIQQILAVLLGAAICALLAMAWLVIIARFDEIIAKWSCKHYWQVHKQTLVKDLDLGTMRKEETLICRKCGKIKKIKL